MPASAAVCRGPTRTRLTTSTQQVRAHNEFSLLRVVIRLPRKPVCFMVRISEISSCFQCRGADGPAERRASTAARSIDDPPGRRWNQGRAGRRPGVVGRECS